MDDIVIINSELVNDILNKNKPHIVNMVRDTYLNFHKGGCVNPDSFFLRFPDNDRNRIIGLASSNTSGENKISGIKLMPNRLLVFSNSIKSLKDNKYFLEYS